MKTALVGIISFFVLLAIVKSAEKDYTETIQKLISAMQTPKFKGKSY